MPESPASSFDKPLEVPAASHERIKALDPEERAALRARMAARRGRAA